MIQLLFDYFFDHEYHLSEYTINLLDCIIAYEFELFSRSGFYKKLVKKLKDNQNGDDDDSDFEDECGYWLFTYRFADYDIYYMELDKQMGKLVKEHPEALDIMDHMMFRNQSIYYIMKLLDSPMSKKCNPFTKRMLKKFIIPYKENKLSDLAMLCLHDCEIEADLNNPIMDVTKQYQNYHCLICHKLCYRTKHDMMKEIDIYTRTVNPESSHIDNAFYTNPTKRQICGFSFCSSNCQGAFCD